LPLQSACTNRGYIFSLYHIITYDDAHHQGSIRKAILDNYKKLGLTSVPNKGDNGVHASASPFEGLAEKW